MLQNYPKVVVSSSTPYTGVLFPAAPLYGYRRLTISEQEKILVTKVTGNSILRPNYQFPKFDQEILMKYFVWLATLSLLILGIYCGTMISVNQPVQAAMFSEGSFPSPDMHPAQLAAERGEGAYPTPCPPSRPCLAPAEQPKLQAGEGAYPTPCPPSRPCLAPAEQPKLQAGEGAYPTPCPPSRPCLAPAEQPKLQAGEGAYPTPCPPSRPCLAPAEQPNLQAGEGAYPTPCPPSRPCHTAEQPKLQAGEGAYPTPCPPSRPCVTERNSVAVLLSDGAAPAPYELPGGMN